jgi:hypothetical protein
MSVQPVTSTDAAFDAVKSNDAGKNAHHAGASFAGALAEASAAKKTARTKLVHNEHGDYRAPRKERTKPVEGHAYADILSGPRNGLYVNTSGNKRHGEAFQLVERDGKRYHIYGEGKDRLVVCLKPKKKVDATDQAKTDAKTDKTPEATAPGGVTAPSGTTGASS